MKRQCKYHPLSPALWWSDEFQAGYCERCVDYSESAAGAPKAKNLLTGNQLEYLGSAHSAVPFWERIPQFFKFPIQGDAVIFLVAVMIVGSIFAAIGGLAALAGGLFALVAITIYGFLVIERTAMGNFTPPPWDKAFSGNMNLFFKQVGVQIIFGVFLFGVGMLGIQSLNLLATLLVLLVMPASMMIFAMDEDIGSAVSPGRLFDFITRIGGAYMILYVFLICFSTAHIGLFSMLAEEMPDTWLGPLFLSTTLYFMLVMYHLMGYVIFQYQSELGFVSEDEKTAQRRVKSIDPYDARIDVFVKEGRYDQALKVFKKALSQHPNDFQKHDRLSKLLIAMGETEVALEHGNSYLSKLHKDGDDARLYFIYSSYLQIDEHFLPDDPAVRLILAEQLYGRGKYDSVIKLLGNMHKQFPHFPDIAAAYYLIAEALYHGKDMSQKALQFLAFVMHHYPDASNLEQVKMLAKEIKSA